MVAKNGLAFHPGLHAFLPSWPPQDFCVPQHSLPKNICIQGEDSAEALISESFVFCQFANRMQELLQFPTVLPVSLGS